MVVSVQYTLAGAGWSECICVIDDQQACLKASYLSDALADLLDAVAVVVRGADQAVAFFTEEPGEYRLRFTRMSQDRLCICILWFNEIWSDRPDSEGEVVLEVECRLRTFAGAVLSASQQVLATYGLEGYREKWINYGFPVKSHAKLREALD